MRRFYARAASISENLPRMWQDRHKYIIYATARCIGMSRALRRFDHWTHVCYTQRREPNGAMKGSGKMKTRMNGKQCSSQVPPAASAGPPRSRLQRKAPPLRLRRVREAVAEPKRQDADAPPFAAGALPPSSKYPLNRYGVCNLVRLPLR